MPPLKWRPDAHDGEKVGANTIIDLSAEVVNHAVSVLGLFSLLQPLVNMTLKLQLHPYFCDNFSTIKPATLDGQTPFVLDYWTELRVLTLLLLLSPLW